VQQNQKSREQELQSKQKQVEQQKVSAVEGVCSSCQTINKKTAKFCEECGEPLEVLLCPECRSAVYPDADICEKCGAWLLPGKCRFCYADISDEDSFCPECGNPAGGIKCTKCSEMNFFDFCKKCNSPLTESALIMMAQAQNDPAQKEIEHALKQLAELEKSLEQAANQSQIDEKAKREKDEKLKRLRMLESFYKTSSEKKEISTPKRESPKSLFNEEQEKRLSAAEKEKRHSEIEARRKQLQKELDKSQNKTFETPQKARCFFNATKPPGNLVWECNFVHAIHPAPHDCAKPHLGGKWIIHEGHIKWERGYF